MAESGAVVVAARRRPGVSSFPVRRNSFGVALLLFGLLTLATGVARAPSPAVRPCKNAAFTGRVGPARPSLCRTRARGTPGPRGDAGGRGQGIRWPAWTNRSERPAGSTWSRRLHRTDWGERHARHSRHPGPGRSARRTGRPGCEGAVGAEGSAGVEGAPGAEGPKGLTGLMGAEGAEGAMGFGLARAGNPQGAEGPAGPKGLTGASGSKGPRLRRAQRVPGQRRTRRGDWRTGTDWTGRTSRTAGIRRVLRAHAVSFCTSI